MFHFKRVQEYEDCKGGEDGGTSTVDGIAPRIQAMVTVDAEVPVSDNVDDDDEAEKWGGAHDDSVDEDVASKFLVEDSRDDIVGRTMHYIVSRGFQSQPNNQHSLLS